MSFILDTDHCIAILRGKLDVSEHIEPTASLYGNRSWPRGMTTELPHLTTAPGFGILGACTTRHHLLVFLPTHGPLPP